MQMKLPNLNASSKEELDKGFADAIDAFSKRPEPDTYTMLRHYAGALMATPAPQEEDGNIVPSQKTAKRKTK